jgi:hypothetical protein
LKTFVKGVAEINDPTTWPEKGFFKNFQPMEVEEGDEKEEPEPKKKRRKSDSALSKSKRAKTVISN